MFLFVSFLDEQLIYTGPKTSFAAGGLKPVSVHSFYLRTKTEDDESPYSKIVSISTPESGTVLVVHDDTELQTIWTILF